MSMGNDLSLAVATSAPVVTAHDENIALIKILEAMMPDLNLDCDI
jgi:hypothetical protein